MLLCYINSFIFHTAQCNFIMDFPLNFIVRTDKQAAVFLFIY